MPGRVRAAEPDDRGRSDRASLDGFRWRQPHAFTTAWHPTKVIGDPAKGTDLLPPVRLPSTIAYLRHRRSRRPHPMPVSDTGSVASPPPAGRPSHRPTRFPVPVASTRPPSGSRAGASPAPAASLPAGPARRPTSATSLRTASHCRSSAGAAADVGPTLARSRRDDPTLRPRRCPAWRRRAVPPARRHHRALQAPVLHRVERRVRGGVRPPLQHGHRADLRLAAARTVRVEGGRQSREIAAALPSRPHARGDGRPPRGRRRPGGRTRSRSPPPGARPARQGPRARRASAPPAVEPTPASEPAVPAEASVPPAEPPRQPAAAAAPASDAPASDAPASDAPEPVAPEPDAPAAEPPTPDPPAPVTPVADALRRAESPAPEPPTGDAPLPNPPDRHPRARSALPIDAAPPPHPLRLEPCPPRDIRSHHHPPPAGPT